MRRFIDEEIEKREKQFIIYRIHETEKKGYWVEYFNGYMNDRTKSGAIWSADKKEAALFKTMEIAVLDIPYLKGEVRIMDEDHDPMS